MTEICSDSSRRPLLWNQYTYTNQHLPKEKIFCQGHALFWFFKSKNILLHCIFSCFIWKLYKHKPFAPVICRTRSEPQAQQPRLSLSQGLEHFGISRQPENRSIRWLPLCSGIHKLPLPTAIRWISHVAYVTHFYCPLCLRCVQFVCDSLVPHLFCKWPSFLGLQTGWYCGSKRFS